MYIYEVVVLYKYILDVTEERYRSMEVSDMAESTATKSNHPYKVDDYVVYRRSGICRIADIRMENFSSVGEREYYVMKPLHDDRSKFLRDEMNGDRKEWVLMEADGPGAIVRFWITAPNYVNNLYFYIDKSSKA